MKMRLKISALVLATIIIQSCGTGKMFTNKNFNLDYDTSIAVEIGYDPNGVASLLEGRLLGLGLNVVPFDMAQRVAQTNISSNRNNINISSSGTTYVPSALLLKVDYKYVSQHVGTQLKALNIRLIDLSNTRVLANFQYDSSVGKTKSGAVDGFITELKKFLK